MFEGRAEDNTHIVGVGTLYGCELHEVCATLAAEVWARTGRVRAHHKKRSAYSQWGPPAGATPPTKPQHGGPGLPYGIHRLVVRAVALAASVMVLIRLPRHESGPIRAANAATAELTAALLAMKAAMVAWHDVWGQSL